VLASVLVSRSLALDEVFGSEAILAYEVNGAPLPPQHGFPLRLVVPGWYGMTSVKWLSRISLLGAPFDGFQMRHSYRVRLDEDEPGDPITLIAPRSLMIPPGIPEFTSRTRVVEAGTCELHGRAWSGESEVVAVYVSTDAGETWTPAELGEAALGRWAWRSWRYAWEAEPGEHELCCRARDAAASPCSRHIAASAEAAWPTAASTTANLSPCCTAATTAALASPRQAEARAWSPTDLLLGVTNAGRAAATTPLAAMSTTIGECRIRPRDTASASRSVSVNAVHSGSGNHQT